MASVNGETENRVLNGYHNPFLTEFEEKVNMVRNEVKEVGSVVEEILRKIETKANSIQRKKVNEEDFREFSRELEWLYFKLLNTKIDIKKRETHSLVNREKDSPLHAFQKKLTISDDVECEVQNTFEFDSPDSDEEMCKFDEECNRNGTLETSPVIEASGSNLANSRTETETDVTDGCDIEADLKWKDNLFVFNYKLNNELGQGTVKSSSISSKKDCPSNGSTSGVHSGAAIRSVTLVKQPYVAMAENTLKSQSVPTGRMISVTVAYVISPSLFWLHHTPRVNEHILTKLQKAQNLLLRTESWRVKQFRKKMLIAASYSKDGFWYRAEVTNILGKDENGKLQLEVRYIDYGNSETITEDDVTILSDEFLQYEPQAVRCCLTHVCEKAQWSEETITFFRKTLEESSDLTAYFYPGMLFENDTLLYSAEVFDGPKNIIDLLPNQRRS